MSHKKITSSCKSLRLFARLIIWPNVSSSESSTSHWRMRPILRNFDLALSNRKAEISVKEAFWIKKDSSRGSGFKLRISSRRKSLKNQALSANSSSQVSKSGHPVRINRQISRANGSTAKWLSFKRVRKRRLRGWEGKAKASLLSSSCICKLAISRQSKRGQFSAMVDKSLKVKKVLPEQSRAKMLIPWPQQMRKSDKDGISRV